MNDIRKMKLSYDSLRRRLGILFRLLLALAVLNCCLGADSPKPGADAAQTTGGGNLVPLDIKLPSPAFKGTPKEVSGHDVFVVRGGKVVFQAVIVDPAKK